MPSSRFLKEGCWNINAKEQKESSFTFGVSMSTLKCVAEKIAREKRVFKNTLVNLVNLVRVT